MNFNDGPGQVSVVGEAANLWFNCGNALNGYDATSGIRIVRILHEFENADLFGSDELLAQYRDQASVGNETDLFTAFRAAIWLGSQTCLPIRGRGSSPMSLMARCVVVWA